MTSEFTRVAVSHPVFTGISRSALAGLLVELREPWGALAVLFGVDRATITRAVHQVRPLLAARGFQTPEGPRLRTLADVFAYASEHGIQLRVDGTEIAVRRPAAGTPGRRAFVSGNDLVRSWWVCRGGV